MRWMLASLNAGGNSAMERTFGENWRNAVLGIALTIAVVGGGLAAALW